MIWAGGPAGERDWFGDGDWEDWFDGDDDGGGGGGEEGEEEEGSMVHDFFRFLFLLFSKWRLIKKGGFRRNWMR